MERAACFSLCNRLHHGGNLRFSEAQKRMKQKNLDEGRATVEFSTLVQVAMHISSGRRFSIDDDLRVRPAAEAATVKEKEKRVDKRRMARRWEEKGKKERDPDFIFVDELGIGPTRLNIYSLSLPLFLSLALLPLFPPLPSRPVPFSFSFSSGSMQPETR